VSDNLLLYSSIEDDDVDYLNSIEIKEDDWEKNKEIYLFKQKIIEKNYSEMYKNILVSRELDSKLNKYSSIEGSNYIAKENLKNSLLTSSPTNTETIENSQVRKISNSEKKIEIRMNNDPNKSNSSEKVSVLDNLLNLKEYESIDLPSVLIKDKIVLNSEVENSTKLKNKVVETKNLFESIYNILFRFTT
jgi:hypothetical protein